MFLKYDHHKIKPIQNSFINNFKIRFEIQILENKIKQYNVH